MTAIQPREATPYLYRVSGWTVGSPRPLPYLLACDDMAVAPDIEVAFEPLAPIGAAPAVVLGSCHIFAPGLVDLRLPSGLNIRISAGHRLTVEQPPGCSETDVHAYLFGSAFTILAQQRGRPMLHASAMEIDGAAIAVAGHSGAGKSTTARALMQRGHRLLADDKLMVDAETGVAHASYPSTKLWADAAALLGHPLGDAPRVRPDLDKFHLSAADQFSAASLPLKGIFLLVRDGALAQPSARRLPPAEALATLPRFVHYPNVMAALGAKPAIFRWAAGLAGRTSVHLVHRPEDPDKVDALIDLLLELSAA
ncbi:MAG: hypothetical protein ABW360_11970 [Phenylobacterium sp.]